MPSSMKFVYGLILVNVLVIVAAAAFADFIPWVCALGLTSVLNVIVFCERPGSEKAPPIVQQVFFKTRDRIKGCEPIEKGTAKLLLMTSPLAYVLAILISGHKISPVCFATINALGLITLANLGLLIWPEYKNLTGWFTTYYKNNIRGWMVMYWLMPSLEERPGTLILALKVVPRSFSFQLDHLLSKNLTVTLSPHIMMPIGGWILFRKCWTLVCENSLRDGLRLSSRWQAKEPGCEVCSFQYVRLTDWESPGHETRQLHVREALRVVGGSS